MWIVVLLFFAGLITLVLRFQNTPQKAAQAGRAAMIGGPVAVVPATAQKGDIGVYLEAIGTVTPVYTSSVTSQVTGLVMAVHYREGSLVRKGDPLIDIDPRPFEAQLAQAQGTLEKDTHILAQAKMDLERYRAAWARNAIAKQILDDQEKTVLQDEGTVKADQGLVQFDQVQLAYCHITAPFDRARGSAADRSRQRGAGQQHHSAGGHHSGAAHHRDLHRRRGLPRPDAGPASSRRPPHAWMLMIAPRRPKSPPASC